MTAESKAYAVRIADLLILDTFQVRDRGTDPGTVARYAKVLQNIGAFRDPITVAFIRPPKGTPAPAALRKGEWRKKRIATGTLVLLDGFHRVAAALQVGVEELPAVVIETTEEEAGWLAAKANTCNGLPLKTKEYRKVLDRYVRARRYFNDGGKTPKSYREIAGELGGVASYSAIRRWMLADHPGVFRLLQMHGKDDAPGGLPERKPWTTWEHVVWEAGDALRGAANALPNLSPKQRGEVAIVAASLVLDCQELGTDLHGDACTGMPV